VLYLYLMVYVAYKRYGNLDLASILEKGKSVERRTRKVTDPFADSRTAEGIKVSLETIPSLRRSEWFFCYLSEGHNTFGP